MNVRKRISAAVLAVAMAGAAFGLGGPASAATDQAATGQHAAAAVLPDLPGGTPKGRQNIGPRLNPGDVMTETQYVGSANGQHRLAADGWLTPRIGLYLSSWSTTPHEISKIDTTKKDVENRLVMQGDGNLVLYTDGFPTWNSRTHNNPGAYAVLQDDRNLVVRASDGRALFATATAASDAFAVNALGRTWTSTLAPGWYLQSTDGHYRLLMQTDGNLVLYAGGRALWHTRTNGNPGAQFSLQPDGNLVVRATDGRALWNSRTARSGENVFGLVLQRDGNLVEYQNRVTGGYPVPVAIWSSNTAGRR